MSNILNRVLLFLLDALPDISNILLAIVGVLMSFPAKADKIERSPVLRRVVACSCISVGVAGLVVSTHQRQQFNSEIQSLISDNKKLVINTSSLVSSTNTMVAGFGILTPKLGALETRLAEIKVQIAAAKGNPRLVAELQGQATAAQAQVHSVSKTIVLSLAQGIVGELLYWSRKWSDDDREVEREIDLQAATYPPNASQQEIEKILAPYHKKRADLNADYTKQVLPIMTSANYLREQLLSGSEQTQEDKMNAVIFAKVLAGETIDWSGMGNVAGYMGRLVAKFAAPASPSNLAVSVQ